jgi:glycerophosphoryl diester phosphodiesterase
MLPTRIKRWVCMTLLSSKTRSFGPAYTGTRLRSVFKQVTGLLQKLIDIQYQSFDWRTLIAMKELNPHMITSALVELDTALPSTGQPSPWLAGLNLNDFGGPEVTIDVRIARAAASLGADILSPAAGTGGNGHGVIAWEPFTTKAMVDEAHRLGVLVKPWTVNNLDVLEDHYSWGVDGTITDCQSSLVVPWLRHSHLCQTPTLPAVGPNTVVFPSHPSTTRSV